MQIAYYMPFKPPGHRNPSGDLITGMELHDFLRDGGHSLTIASRLRCRWLYLKPWRYPQLAFARQSALRHTRKSGAELWLSYHSYYKAPDLLGPWCSRTLSIPYVIFQGIYSTKRRRSAVTYIGFVLNRRALQQAQLVFTNKKRDEINLKRLLEEPRVRYIAPGIEPAQFDFDHEARVRMRANWRTGDRPVVLSTAMLRPGVKSRGIEMVMKSCAALRADNQPLLLVIAGDGEERARLTRRGHELLGDNVLFLGRITRTRLFECYSGADIFAFPGIDESLGMVYLEAQSCGLPVVACGDWGARETVIDKVTGLLTEFSRPETFTAAIKTLLNDAPRRTEMGHAAARHIRAHHDLSRNYRQVERTLRQVVDGGETK
jgi:glycosyltransferase involved in cell wall biosynthesis